MLEQLSVLDLVVIGICVVLTGASKVPLADALDALAVAWTAQRHLAGRSVRVPALPPVDVRGVPMAIIT